MMLNRTMRTRFIRRKIHDRAIQMAWWHIPNAGEFDIHDRHNRLLKRYRELDLLKIYPKSRHDAEVQVVRDEVGASLKSNDASVIALARVSGARLLVAHDNDLCTDFTNPSVISPHGQVYPIDERGANPLREDHRRLVREHEGCCSDDGVLAKGGA